MDQEAAACFTRDALVWCEAPGEPDVLPLHTYGGPLMKRGLLSPLVFGILGLLVIALTSARAQNQAKKEAPVVPPRTGTSETIKLFNGKDLEGWEGNTE